MRVIGQDDKNKVRLLLSFAGSSRDIADPWYTGNYEKVFEQITVGCKGILERI